MAKATVDTRNYFLTYLVPGELTDSELQTHKQALEALVKKHKGTVVTVEEWGKKKLAYKVKHAGKWHTDAFYLHDTLALPPRSVNAFEHDIYLQAQIIRHLLIIAEEVSAAPTK